GSARGWSCIAAGCSRQEAARFEMRGDLLRLQRAVIEGNLINSPFPVCEVVTTATDEDRLLASRQRDVRITGNLRGRVSVEIDPDASALAHEHDVMPFAPSDGRAASEECVALISIEEYQLAGQLWPVSAANAEMIAGSG